MNKGADKVGDIWSDCRSALEGVEKRVKEEIANYPSPIAGCDQQFNHLLELRAQLPEEKRRLAEAEKRSHESKNPDGAVTEFLAGCPFIDDGSRSRIEASLTQCFRAGDGDQPAPAS